MQIPQSLSPDAYRQVPFREVDKTVGSQSLDTAKTIKINPSEITSDMSVAQSYAQPTAQTSVPLMSESELILTQEQQKQKTRLQKHFPDLSPVIESLSQGLSSVFLQKDAQGQTILSHLSELCESKAFCPEVSSQDVARQLILRLNDRSEIFQGPQYTCGSAALQNYMTVNDPGEMVRIVKALAISARASLRDGSQIKLPSDTQAYLKSQSTHVFNEGKDKDVRQVTDILFQSAVMKDISIVGGDRAWKGEPDNLLQAGSKALSWLTDWADYNAESDDIGLSPKLTGDGGGHPGLIKKLMEGMTGKPMIRESVLNPNNAWGNQSSFRNALSSVKRGENELLTLLKSPLHYVLLTDYDEKNQTVTFLSTGTYAKNSGQKSVTAYVTLPVTDFLSNCGALWHKE